MKSEHRHELKTNDLAATIITAGDYFRIYGGRIALGLAIVILVIVLIYQRTTKARAERAMLPGTLAQARGQIDRLASLQLVPNDKEIEEAKASIEKVKNDASDDALKAGALAAEGDLNWAIATYPNDPTGSGSTTAPAPVTEQQRVATAAAAKAAWQAVVDKYPDQRLAVVTARFGLAALAENSRDWATARQQYEAVLKLPNLAKAHKQMAEGRLAYLELIQKPVLIGDVKAGPDPVTLDPNDYGDGTGNPLTRATTTGPATKGSTTGSATTTTTTTKGPTTKPAATTAPEKK
ncbi:MAG TPA: hypothetical protein VEA69_02140 [Tepidisphaeraceae bacterium]|nr:hypothetical protein [Tepidisphaeraceae bacterium]